SERSMSTSKIADQLREKVAGIIPGGDIRVSAQSGLWILRRIFGSGGGEAVEVQLRGYNLNREKKISEEIKVRTEEITEVTGVRTDRREGRPAQNRNFT